MHRKGQTGDIFNKVMLIVAVPIMLIVGLLVYGQFAPTANAQFAQTYENETFTPASLPSEVILSNTPMIEDSDIYAGYWYDDSTSNLVTLTEGDNYTVNSYDNGKVNFTSVSSYNDTDGDYLSLDYDAMTKSGSDAAVTTSQNTYSGFNLAAVLPIVIAAVAVLSLVVSAMAIRT